MIMYRYLFGALHEARAFDGIATVFAAQSVVVITVAGIVIFVLLPHHPEKYARKREEG
jgi:hypothetical protein